MWLCRKYNNYKYRTPKCVLNTINDVNIIKNNDNMIKYDILCN